MTDHIPDVGKMVPIPHHWQFYPLHLFADPAHALTLGMPRPPENPQGVLMDPAVFRTLPKAIDPKVRAQVARQQGNCMGCGDVGGAEIQGGANGD